MNLSRRIMISASKDAVQAYLRDLRNMAQYERKVGSVKIVNQTEDQAEIDVEGKFMGLRWKGGFAVSFTRDGGYRSEMKRGPLRKMQGGFQVRTVPGGVILTREEQYKLPFLMRPLRPMISRWVGRTMEQELFTIKEGAEALNRRMQLQQIEAQGLLNARD
jgi:hypothetical protein